MYERNAIVLERYFDRVFCLSEKNSLKENYLNYRKLLECYEKYTATTNAEKIATEEFKQVSNEIARIQKIQEKLYNRDAKFEYSRNVVFNNIEEKPEEIEKYLAKIEGEISKISDEVIKLGHEFVATVTDYNEKKETLERCRKENQDAKKDFESAFKRAKSGASSLEEDNIDFAKEFIASENKDFRKDLIGTIEENGKNEKNQFDPDAISNAVDFSIDVYKIEMEIYLAGIERINKLLAEIEAKDVKLDKHKKFYNDTKAKLDFMQGKKEYLVQFLDNERIAAIYDKKMHRKLMLEACRNLIADLGQINNLYDIILKDCLGRSTKRLYKENYNKQYLFSMERNAEDTSSSKIKNGSVAVMNLNYWRIEGIKRVYDAFDKDVTEIYGRDLAEFNVPQPEKIEIEIQVSTEDVPEIPKETIKKEPKEVAVKEKPKSVEPRKVKLKLAEIKEKAKETVAAAKATVAEAEIAEQEQAIPEIVEKDETTVTPLERVKKIIAQRKTKKSNVKHLSTKDYGVLTSTRQAFTRAVYLSIKSDKTKSMKKAQMQEKEVYFDLDAKMAELDLLEDDTQAKEDSVLDMYFKEQDKYEKKRKEKDNQKLDEDIEKLKKGNILKKIININSKTKKEA